MHTVFRPTSSFALLLKLVLAPANRGVEPSGRKAAFKFPRLCELGSVIEVHLKRFWIALVGRYAFSPLRGPPTTTLQPLLEDRETRLADEVEAVHFDFN